MDKNLYQRSNLTLQYLEHGIVLKTGATIFFFIVILALAAIDRMEWAPASAPQRLSLVAWLAVLFLVVILGKAVIWNNIVANLTTMVSSQNNSCTDLETKPQPWLSEYPGRAINNWSLPSLAIALQDSAPTHYLLTTTEDCKRLSENGEVALTPWESIPVWLANCRVESPAANCRQ